MPKLPAVFARGGTSKGLIFHRRDLPADRAAWDAIFLAAMGSPDPYGRQLDGLGGGVSSLSKVCIVGPATRSDADVDYTFAQVQIREAAISYLGNCGNMSAAIGPFAVDEGLVPPPPDGDALVRIHNTNTGKIIHARFGVRGGRSVTEGSLVIPGVAGQGAPVRLDFLDPGGAVTGCLLPGAGVAQPMNVPGLGLIDASLIDAANPVVFVDASALGLRGDESPERLDRDGVMMDRIEAIRRLGAVAMGIATNAEAAAGNTTIPYLALVAPAMPCIDLAGNPVGADAMDMTLRVIASGQPHRAAPLTVSLCAAVATMLDGSIPRRMLRGAPPATLRLATPSGVLQVDADVTRVGDVWHARRGSFFRTTRRLFEGFVHA